MVGLQRALFEHPRTGLSFGNSGFWYGRNTSDLPCAALVLEDIWKNPGEMAEPALGGAYPPFCGGRSVVRHAPEYGKRDSILEREYGAGDKKPRIGRSADSAAGSFSWLWVDGFRDIIPHLIPGNPQGNGQLPIQEIFHLFKIPAV